MTGAIAVPAPTLTFADAAGGVAALEQPVTVAFGQVTRDGAALGPVDLRVFGFLVGRRAGPGAAPQIWDDGAKAWVPDSPGTAATPVPLAYREGQPAPWEGLLVAAGAVDPAGVPAFASAVAGYPLYAVRGAFTTTDGTAAVGPPGPNLTFVSAAARNLLVIGPGEDEKPESATTARLLLKDTARAVIGGVTIVRDSPGAVVTVDNAAGARVVLRADGSIELRPAPGRAITLAGDLDTERITYRPEAGGPKRMLT